ncbi:MAG: ABC-F family ATP-binding cassette domain-containing protein [Acidimicrobiia bacterium]|nr:ABC-F family ATP-binding cassette domain-containing protein [Acidimicrobiia bacterium]
MLTISGLCKSHPGHVLFDDADLVIGRRERVGVVGRNGCGKTTLLRILLGEESVDAGTVTIPKHHRIGHVDQHLAFTAATVLAEAEAALRPNTDGWTETHRAEEILSGLGFGASDLAAAPDSLSGGYQMRLALARVLLADPDLMLLDEPTNHLDVVSIRWLERFLSAWRGELVLVTHDRSFMDTVCTHTAAVHRHRFRKVTGGTEKLYTQLAREAETETRTDATAARQRREIEMFARRFRAQATKARAVQSRLKRLERLERERAESDDPSASDTAAVAFSTAPFPGKTLLEVDGLGFGWSDTDTLIGDLSFTIAPGDRVAVAGPNGRGKTTLLRLIAGDLEARSGSIRRSPNLCTGWFGQSTHVTLDDSRTVEAEIMDALAEANRTRARGLAGRMLFEGADADKRIGVLSGGERSRVLLAKVMAAPANLLLLDEPTNHLDIETVEALSDAIDTFPGAVVLVTHDEDLLTRHAERLVVFDAGSVTCHALGYADFLERVGWSAERDEPAHGQARLGADTPHKTARKARRRRVAERNAVLRPLQTRVAELEAEIASLEESAARIEVEIGTAAAAGDGVGVTRLAHDMHDLAQRRDDLYASLAAVSDRLEASLAEFAAAERL